MFQKTIPDHVLLVTEDGTTCNSNGVVDVVDNSGPRKAIEDTSLSEAAKLTLPASQEHGEASFEQQ